MTTFADALDNPYVLLTPGPLSTSPAVREAMLRDWCTWGDDYKQVVQRIREKVVALATSSKPNRQAYTTVLMQGSGTFAVESVIGSVIPPRGKLLLLVNGAYGQRMVRICEKLAIRHVVLDTGETHQPDVQRVDALLSQHKSVSHVAMVHCETTTGMLNNLFGIAQCVKQHQKTFIVDAMSSFGGVPLDVHKLGIDFLVTSANKCIQGVPGFGIVIALREKIESCKGLARSLSLDLHDQWQTMKAQNGKWRFTSPTHAVKAFDVALEELEAEGGIPERYKRYCTNQQTLVRGMKAMGFQCLLKEALHSPVITAFHYPASQKFEFKQFYNALAQAGFIIYPGQVTHINTFRIGNIGHIFPRDIENLLVAIEKSIYWS